jgi:hypothetical protein
MVSVCHTRRRLPVQNRTTNVSDEELITREPLERHFAQVPDDLITDPRLGHLAIRLWCRLDKYAGRNNQAFPLRETLADDLGVSVGGIKRALIELTKAGWIVRKRRRNGGSWITQLQNVPGVPVPPKPEKTPESDGSNMSRPRPTGEPTTAHGRATEGHPPKNTQSKAASRAAAAPTPPGPTPRAAPSQAQKQQREEDHPWSKVIRDAIPNRFSRSINRKTMNSLARELQANGWTDGSLHLAIRAEDWDSANSAGAIVEWLRGAEPPRASKDCEWCKGFGFYSEPYYEDGPNVVQQCDNCISDDARQYRVASVEYSYTPTSTPTVSDPWATDQTA